MSSITEKGCFVTGTDTGVGKTIVAAAIVAGLRERNIKALPMKAVQTGCSSSASGVRTSNDLELMLKLNGLKPSQEERSFMCPYLFDLPASPQLAARKEGKAVSADFIVACHQELLKRCQTVVVEGSGGLLVPLNESAFMADLVSALKIPAVVVARPSLGTLNHTLLTLRELEHRQIPVAGIILSCASPDSQNEIEDDNERMLTNFAGNRCVVRFPYIAGLATDHAVSTHFRVASVQYLAPLLED